MGWGEAITGAQETSLATAFMVERRLSPIVLGRDPRDVRGAWTAMRDATYWDGNGGIVTFGISAVDMALWDVAGRLEGKPVYELLGGARTDRLPACASTILDMGDPERVAREFRGFVDAGYRFVKGGWGHDLSIAFGRDDARDLSIGRTIRDAVVPDTQVILDVVALAGWDAEHAIRMCRGAGRPDRVVLAGGPAPGAGPRRLPTTAGRGRYPDLYRREGLARGPLPGSHRLGCAWT